MSKMPAELRYIEFSPQESMIAVEQYCQNLAERPLSGTVIGLKIVGDDRPCAHLSVLNGNGVVSQIEMNPEELLSAHISFCLAHRIPLPAHAIKTLRRCGSAVTLISSLRFLRLYATNHGYGALTSPG